MHFSPVGESLLGSAFSSPRLTPGAFFIAVSRAPAKSDTRDGLPEKQGSAFNLRYGTVPLDLVEAFLQVQRPL